MNQHLCTQCSHPFSHPLVLTNKGGESSETYYACPYCLSKVDMDEKDLVTAFREEMKTTRFVEKTRENPEQSEHSEAEADVWKNIAIPNECLDCANLLPCVHTLITLMESRKGNPERQSPVCKFR